MNRLISFLLTTIIICPAAQALNINTDVSCKKLVTAINQEHTLESCKASWQGITKSNISVHDQTIILDQALQLAQSKKAIFDEELTNLGDETKNHSKIKWGVGQLIAGTYLSLAQVYLVAFLFINKQRIPGVHAILWPESFLIQNKWISKTGGGVVIASRFILVNPVLATYCLYKGYKNLRQGLNHKQFLKDKITNLDAIIAYFQYLQTNNQ